MSDAHVMTTRSRRRLPPKAVLVSAGAVLGLIIIGLVAFGPIVRSKVASEAARRDLEVTVGSVRPGFFAATLRDVHVRPRAVPEIDVRLDEVRVDLSVGLSVQEVTAHGGQIDVSGEPEEIFDRLKSAKKTTSSETTSKSKLPLSMDGIGLAWKLPSGGELSGSGLHASRNASATKLGCLKCSASHKHVTLEIADGEVELAPDSTLRRVTASAMNVAYEPPKAAPAASAKAATNEPTPPPLPSVVKKGAKPVNVKAPAAPPIPDEPVLPLPDLHALRARIGAIATTLGGRIPDGSRIEIGGLSVKTDVDGDPVAIGPGGLSVARNGERIHVSFATEKGAAGSTPLSIDADLPLAAGDVTLHLSGGPVSLGVLGVKEGTKGLQDVTRGTVSGKGQIVLSQAGDALTFDGQVALRSITIKNARLSSEPIRGLDLSVAARGVLDDMGKLRVDDAQLDMGALHLRTHGTIEETKEHFAVALALDVAPSACQALVESTPPGLLPIVRSMRMTGTFGATARVAFDTRAIDKLALEYQIDDRCKFTEVPREYSRDHFGGTFSYRAYHPDGTAFEATTGPGSSSWTDLDDISPFMIAAVLTTEDGAFYKHHGFNHAAIRNSTAANLKARRFIRGASTITMQLAKNLFLTREKTLSRKIEEVVLTAYLEQIFRKDDMMELYLNVVEFGPDVYGITHAADYYFGRKPEELNVAECLFLASLLPSPVRYGKMRDKGEVSENWMKHLSALMEIAARNGKITSAELTEGQSQKVVFVKPGDPRPEPRKPVTKGHHGDDRDDDAAWQPID